MFTGIVEKIGEVISSSKNVLSITANFDNLVIGESIAIDGTCLTLKSFSGKNLSFDLSGQTVETTSVKSFEKGKKVNLERAMLANGRFGGHFVSGHIDTVTKVKSVSLKDGWGLFSFYIPDGFANYFVKKGSVSIDGVSLTIADIKDKVIELAIIPHTLLNTTLHLRKPGDIVNVECDILAKYTHSQSHNSTSKITSEFLKKNGY